MTAMNFMGGRRLPAASRRRFRGRVLQLEQLEDRHVLAAAAMALDMTNNVNVVEFVDRPGWADDSALALTIEGGGNRTAEAHDGDASAAPLLHVEYTAQETPDPTDQWTMVVLPDTQKYSESSTLISRFENQTNWIASNINERNIVFVSHEGDIVNNGASSAEWQRADQAIRTLDGDLQGNADGLVPYSAVIGNHDYFSTGDRGSGTGNYIEYFGPSRYAGRSWYGGSSANQLNHFQLFRAGGYTFLHLGLEWEVEGTTGDPSTPLGWAQSILDQFPYTPAIITTHSYVWDEPGQEGRTTSAQTNGGNSGEEIFQQLVQPNDQVFMTLNGHWHRAANGQDGEFHQVSLNQSDHPVYQMLANFQDYPNGGDGWLRTIQFQRGGGSSGLDRIQVETYSPSLDSFQTDGNSQFAFDLDFDARLNLAGGINVDPHALADVANTNVNASVSIDVLRNDFDPNPGDEISIDGFTQTDGGSVLLQDDVLVYTPNFGFTGNDSFDYTIVDGNGGTATSTVTITVAPPAQTVTFQNGQDGYAGTVDTILQEALPSVENSQSAELTVDSDDPSGSGNDVHALLQFNDIFGNGINRIPIGATILSASLTLDTTNAGSGARIHRMLSAWDDTDTWNTWNNGIQADGLEAIVESDLTTDYVPQGLQAFDVSNSIQAWANGENNLGWTLLPLGNDGWDFYSAEGPTQPLLTVKYATSAATLIRVDAAGATGEETMELQIDGEPVQSWANVGGDFDNRIFQSFSYTHPTSVAPDRIRVAFTNDGITSTGADKNLRVDGVIIDGTKYESESPDVLSTGTWSPENGCAPGNKQSEVLHCQGYLQFAEISSGTEIVESRVNQSTDDAEERLSDGGVYLDSSDIELGNDPGYNGDQVEGLRFQNLNIPQGATITAAYIEFEADEAGSGLTSLNIRAQAADNATTFTSASNNVTSRLTTSASVNWNPGAWIVDNKYQTPDLASLVQEVVDRGGWDEGNSMVFIVSGSGERTAESFDGEPPAAAKLHVEYEPGGVNTQPLLDTGVVSNVGTAAWTTVALTGNYSSPVVIATPVHVDGNPPLVTRITNTTGNSFDLKVQRAGGSPDDVSGVEVQYFVVDEGVYTQADHGITMEAVLFTSSVTDRRGSWSGELQSYFNTYASPVVLGQVMSYNDSDPSVFWSSGSSRSSIPSSSVLRVGKHVGEDRNTTRADEVVGYVVIESGSGTVNGLSFSADVGADTVKGTDNGSSSYSVAGLSGVSSAVLSQAAMDGGQGSWAVLSGVNPVSGATINLSVDEDQHRDAERRHTTEQVAYLAFASTSLAPDGDARTHEGSVHSLAESVGGLHASGIPVTPEVGSSLRRAIFPTGTDDVPTNIRVSSMNETSLGLRVSAKLPSNDLSELNHRGIVSTTGQPDGRTEPPWLTAVERILPQEEDVWARLVDWS